MIPMIDIRNAKSFTMHLRTASACRSSQRLVLMWRRRMRRARRSVGRRQELDPEDDLRQLSLSTAARSSCATTATSVDLATAEPRTVLDVRRDTIGYVSQFLRAVPRVSRSMSWPSRCSLRAIGARRRVRVPGCLPSSTCPSGCGSCRPRPSPAASSSASISPAASSPICRSCCSTNRRRRSTPPTAPWWSR
jgi:hypothetical protein